MLFIIGTLLEALIISFIHFLHQLVKCHAIFCRFSWPATLSEVLRGSDILVLADLDTKLRHSEWNRKMYSGVVRNTFCKELLLSIMFSISPALLHQSWLLLWFDRIDRRQSCSHWLLLLNAVDIWSTSRLGLDSSHFAKAQLVQYCNRMKTILNSRRLMLYYAHYYNPISISILRSVSCCSSTFFLISLMKKRNNDSLQLVLSSNLLGQALYKMKRKLSLLWQRQPHFCSFQITASSAWNSYIWHWKVLVRAFSVAPVYSQQITFFKKYILGIAICAK